MPADFPPFFKRANVVMFSPPAAFLASWQPRHDLTRIGATCSRKLTGGSAATAGVVEAQRCTTARTQTPHDDLRSRFDSRVGVNG